MQYHLLFVLLLVSLIYFIDVDILCFHVCHISQSLQSVCIFPECSEHFVGHCFRRVISVADVNSRFYYLMKSYVHANMIGQDVTLLRNENHLPGTTNTIGIRIRVAAGWLL